MAESPASIEATPTGEQSHRTKGLLRLTMACNERCPFCNVPQEDYDKLTPSEDATFAELQAFLDDGAQTLTISGGEPTLLRKRLLKIMHHARANGVRFIELQTNAVLITDDYAEALANAGCTSAFVSFLSHVPEHHDALAGLEGAFPKCLAGIDNLLAHGIRVTLNPVTAHRTQHLVADYIDFVAERLPGVTFISMSAVQPHGRARHDADHLLPDYAVLREQITEARRRAQGHGIELVNPYCGLPLCVGWDDAQEQSVEAFEARGGGWRRTHGLDNLGNKSHGEPCRTCALRTRCGGAWHAYWRVRDGAGIRAPELTVEPWLDGADDTPAQTVVVAPGGLTSEAAAACDAATTPTVWVWTDGLAKGDARRLLRSGCTDVAVDLATLDPQAIVGTLGVIKQLMAANRQLEPQMQLKVFVGIRPFEVTNPRAVARAGSLAAVLGVHGVRVLSAAPRWRRVADALRAQHGGLDVAAVSARPFPQGEG